MQLFMKTFSKYLYYYLSFVLTLYTEKTAILLKLQ